MLFSRSEKKEEENKEPVSGASENFQSADLEFDIESKTIEDYQKHGFYGALRGKSCDEIVSEHKTYVKLTKDQIEHKVNIQKQRLNDHIDRIQQEIDEVKKLTEAVEPYTRELEEERGIIVAKVSLLENEIDELIENLGNFHKDSIYDRIVETKKELKELTNTLNEVSENKLKNEPEIKEAIKKHRNLCDQLIESSEETLKNVNERIANGLSFGRSKFSASMMLSMGLLGSVAAGIAFGMFASANGMNPPSWLFFLVTNFFEFMTGVVNRFSGTIGFSLLMLGFVVVFAILSLIIYLCAVLLDKTSEDKIDIQLGVDMSEKEDRNFRLLLKTSSLLTFWLHIAPWIFLMGTVIIIVGVGQAVSDDPGQLKVLSKFFSNQFIGSVLSLIASGVFFLYFNRVIERRSQATKTSGETKRIPLLKRKYFEMFLLVVVGNGLLLTIGGIQFGSHTNDTASLFTLLFFFILMNATAFVLGSALRFLGLIQERDLEQQKMFRLSNYRKVLSTNKPLSLWIAEERQFKYHFLRIQKEIFGLIRMKISTLKMVASKRISKNLSDAYGEKERRWLKFLGLDKFDETNKTLETYYRINFPEKALKLKASKSKLNELKSRLNEINDLLIAIREKRSDLHNSVHDKVDKLKNSYDGYVLQRIKLEKEQETFLNKLREEENWAIDAIVAGYELGTWVKREI